MPNARFLFLSLNLSLKVAALPALLYHHEMHYLGANLYPTINPYCERTPTPFCLQTPQLPD
jgi:hypothetical protein